MDNPELKPYNDLANDLTREFLSNGALFVFSVVIFVWYVIEDYTQSITPLSVSWLVLCGVFSLYLTWCIPHNVYCLAKTHEASNRVRKGLSPNPNLTVLTKKVNRYRNWCLSIFPRYEVK